MLACLLLFCQDDPVQAQIDEAVRQFEAAIEVDRALTLLSSQLLALGSQASNPIARRLALDLRDGMASAAAPAFIDALVGRPDALGPLQAAFRDASTSAAGRIELAEALLHLDETMSWRAGLLAIADDDGATLGDRLHAARVLLATDDAQAPGILRKLVDGLPGRPAAERDQITSFLRAANTSLTRELLAGLPAPGLGTDEPRARLIDDPDGVSRSAPARAIVKKRETRGETFLTMPSIVAGGVTLLLLVLLLAEILRKA